MKLDVSAKSPAEAPGDVLVLERYAGEERLSPEVRRIDLALGGLLSLALRDQRFEGRVGRFHLPVCGPGSASARGRTARRRWCGGRPALPHGEAGTSAQPPS